MGKRIFDGGIDGFRADGHAAQGEEESDEFHDELDDSDSDSNSNGERYIRYYADAEHYDYDSAC